MSAAVRSRRIVWFSLAALVGVVLVAGVLGRRAAVGAAARKVLHAAGAEDVRLSVSAATPWRAQIDHLDFALKQNRVAARRVVMERDHWWQPRLSALRVEGAEVTVDPRQWAAQDGAPSAPSDVPVDAVSIDGTVRVVFGAGDDEIFEVKFDAARTASTRWEGFIETRAPGARGQAKLAVDFAGPSVSWHEHRTEVDLARFDTWARRLGLAFEGAPVLTGTAVITGTGAYHEGEWSNRARVEWRGAADAQPMGGAVEVDQTGNTIVARVEQAEWDLAPWVPLLRRLDAWPASLSELGGRAGFSGDVNFRSGVWGGAGEARWRDGRVVMTDPAIAATGIAVEIRFDDLERLQSQPGTVKIAVIEAGALAAKNVEVEVLMRGREEFVVSRAELEALGGKLRAEPFSFWPLRNEFEATLLVDGVAVEQVLALTKDVPATATGRVDGRVPVRWVDGGFYFGSGWLELKRGTVAEVELHAQGLLTGGAAPKDVQGEVLQKIENGLLRLVVSELRLDLRPPGGPSERTAMVRLVGRPKSEDVKTTVNLDVNVNGAVEQLLNLGMDSRLRFGGAR